MLSKEEIHNCLSEVMKILAIANIDREDKKLGQYVCDLQKVENYIDKLETDKQKLIEKLEEDNKKDNKSVKYYEQARRECLMNSPYKRMYQNAINCSNARIETRKEIIKILKGESNERKSKGVGLE